MISIVVLATTAVAQQPTLTISVTSGGLDTASNIIQARTGTRVNWEAVPLTVEGIHFNAKLDAAGSRLLRSDGSIQYVLAPSDLQFTYAASASSREVVDEAVRAHNARSGSFARYSVVEHDGTIDMVPTELLTKNGWARHVSPLDKIVTLPTATGHPTELWHEVVVQLQHQGVPIECYNDKQVMDNDEEPPITLRSGTAPARNLLAWILDEALYANHWTLHHSLPGEQESWLLHFMMVQPELDNELNLTPLVP